MAAHHRSAALAVYFPLVNLQEMLRLEHLTALVALIWSLLLELDNMVCGLDFMTSKTCQQASKLVFSSENNHLCILSSFMFNDEIEKNLRHFVQ